MLTASQRVKCRELAEALDRGDVAAYKRAKDSLTPEMKGEVWDQRAQVKAQAERSKQQETDAVAQVTRRGVTFSNLRDLDFWADTAPADDDDEDDTPEQPTDVPLDDIDAGEDDEDEDETEKKSVLYEFEEE